MKMSMVRVREKRRQKSVDLIIIMRREIVLQMISRESGTNNYDAAGRRTDGWNDDDEMREEERSAGVCKKSNDL